MAEDNSFEDKITSWGPNYGYTKNNHFIPKEALPDGIEYLSIGQQITGMMGKSSNGKDRANSVTIVGDLLYTGRIVHATDTYYLIKDKSNDFVYMETSDEFKEEKGYIKYQLIDTDQKFTDSDLLEKLSISDSELVVTKQAINISKSEPIKKTFHGKVLFWNNSKNYGKIVEDDSDFKIHIRKFDLPNGITKLTKSQPVEFKRYRNTKGYLAKDLKLSSFKSDDLKSGDSHLTGKCISWNNDKKCGTIEANKTRYYVHNTNIIGMTGYRKLDKDQCVSFEVYTNGANKTEAIKVALI